MGSVAERVGEEVVSSVLMEVLDEMHGRSSRKWAIVLLSMVVGATIAVLILKRRSSEGAADGRNNQAGSSPFAPAGTSVTN